MDDISSDLKEDKNKEEKEDSNMDWKKSGIDKNERITLKINVQEANAYDAARPNQFNPKIKGEKRKPAPNGLKRIRKKIRDAMDDEDEDENDFILVPFREEFQVQDTTLKKALTDEEKIQFARQAVATIRVQENMVRENAIAQAERILKQAGYKKADDKIIADVRQGTLKSETKEIIKEQKRKISPQKSKPKEVKRQSENLKSEKEAAVLSAKQERAAARDLQQERNAKTKAENTLENIKHKEENQAERKEEKQPPLPEKEEKAPEKEPVQQPEKSVEPPAEKVIEDVENQKRLQEMEVKRMILEKSGRSSLPKNAVDKVLKEAEKNPENKKEIEEQLSRYQRQRDSYGR